MHLEVTFKNLRPRDEVRQRAGVLFGKLEHFLEPASVGQMVVSVEHGTAQIELHIRSGGETHSVSETHDELRTAIDKTFHTMELRLRRAKERRTDHHRADAPSKEGFVASANER